MTDPSDSPTPGEPESQTEPTTQPKDLGYLLCCGSKFTFTENCCLVIGMSYFIVVVIVSPIVAYAAMGIGLGIGLSGNPLFVLIALAPIMAIALAGIYFLTCHLGWMCQISKCCTDTDSMCQMWAPAWLTAFICMAPIYVCRWIYTYLAELYNTYSTDRKCTLCGCLEWTGQTGNL